jgi:hypothetical protein
MCTMCTFEKATPKQSRTTVKKWNQKQVHPRVTDSPNLLRDTRVKVIIVARSLVTPVAQQLYGFEHGVFTSRKGVHSHHFASKSFAAAPEAFSNAYPENEVPNKTKIRLVTKLRDTRSVSQWQVLIERHNGWNYSRTDFNSASAATTGYSSKNSILPLVSWFCAWRGSCVVVRIAF